MNYIGSFVFAALTIAGVFFLHHADGDYGGMRIAVMAAAFGWVSCILGQWCEVLQARSLFVAAVAFLAFACFAAFIALAISKHDLPPAPAAKLEPQKMLAFNACLQDAIAANETKFAKYLGDMIDALNGQSGQDPANVMRNNRNLYSVDNCMAAVTGG